MANEKEVFGMPKVLITFKTKSTTAIARSARGNLPTVFQDFSIFLRITIL